MIKLAFTCTALAIGFWFVGFYKLGDKPLAGHVQEIYRTPLVQQKVEALHHGFEQKLQRLQSADEAPLPKTPREAKPPAAPSPSRARPMGAIEPEPQPVIESRPSVGQPHKAPAHDSLTQSDREGLNQLLAKKLR